ncbi:MAG: hypothetical protein M3O22_06955 [Pseudomonadota bacterium]|nr:hypothetical protein [Pseudomonadota bacterium]
MPPDLKLAFGFISTFLVVISILPYIRDILKGKTQPHIYTWLIWAILQAMGAFAQFSDGAGYGAWATATGAFFCFIIFLLSFRFGTRNITRFDTACLVASFLTLAVYVRTGDGLTAIILVSVIDSLGYFPTFRKSWQEPFTETISFFVISMSSCIFSLLALQNYTLTTALYAVTICFMNSCMIILLLVRRTQLKERSA